MESRGVFSHRASDDLGSRLVLPGGTGIDESELFCREANGDYLSRRGSAPGATATALLQGGDVEAAFGLS